jgi:glyoxylase-like metal-dependent hydrolase (beta-lactamase superfamily II)
MACFASDLIKNLKNVLGERNLNYVLMTHSHYDHIGALPLIRSAFPGVQACGAKHAQEVFQKPGALKAIRELSEQAALDFTPDGPFWEKPYGGRFICGQGRRRRRQTL